MDLHAWAALVRDPLVALGCVDPASRIEAGKRLDPGVIAVREFLAGWKALFGERRVTAAEALANEGFMALDSEIPGLSRQAAAARLSRKAGMRSGGLALVRRKGIGTGPATFSVEGHEDRTDTGVVPAANVIDLAVARGAA